MKQGRVEDCIPFAESNTKNTINKHAGLEGTIVICFASFVVIYFVSFIVATGYQLWAAINDARRANVYQ